MPEAAVGHPERGARLRSVGDGTEPIGDDRAAEESAVRSLVARYCMAVDDGRFDDFERLFAPDARLRVMGTTHEGPSAIRAFMESAQPPEARGRHDIGAMVLDLDPAAGAGRGWVDYVFFDASGAATSIGRYHDAYVRDATGQWVFDLREIVFLGGEPEVAGSWAVTRRPRRCLRRW